MPLRHLTALSLRTRLGFLLLLATLPLTALHGFNLQRQVESRLRDAEVRTEQLARLAAGQYGTLLDQARGVLAALASDPAVTGPDGRACTDAVTTVAALYAWASVIVVADADGIVRCSSMPGTAGVSLADRSYFREVLASGTPAVSDLLLSRVTGRASINVAVPIMSEDGVVRAVAVAGVFADRLSEIARSMAGSVRGAAVSVVDGTATVAARHPDPERYVGRSMAGHPLAVAMLAAEAGSYRGEALDGVDRIVGFASVGPHARLTLGIARSEILADAYRTFWTEVIGTLAVLAIVLGLIRILADRLVLRGLVDLETAAATLGRGGTPDPRPSPGAAPEVQRLAAAFAAMAASIRSRETELREARGAAEAGERAKSAFLSTMSHEIRTPLNAVIGFSQVLLDTPLTPQQREYAELQMEAGRALLALINDILDFAKIEAGRLDLHAEPFETVRLVERARSMVEMEANRKGLSLAVHIDPAAPAIVVGDQVRVQQIVLNFLSNAVKFTDRGGVSMTLRPGTDGRGVRIEIADTGIGIPADRLGDLFQTFVQIHDAARPTLMGTGLGLAISRQLAELMGGSVGVVSAPGGGSIFWADLPLPAAPPPDPSRTRTAPSSPTASAPPPAAGGGRILVVDDVEMNRVLVRALLVDAGYEVEPAESGEEAVAKAAAGVHRAILMDVRMPGVDGLEATRRIRALPPPAGSVPVIGLSAGVLPEEVEACLAAGMTAHTPKPVDKYVLLDLLARVTAGGADDAARPVTVPARGTIATLVDDLGRETVLRLLRLMIGGVERHAAAIRSAGGDREAVAFAAHSLIALGGSLGFMELTARARVLEAACEDPAAAFDAAAADLLACAAATLASARAEAEGLSATVPA